MKRKSESYSEKLKDPRWQKLRLRVFERDKFVCNDCGSNESTLTVHHTHYERGAPWETRMALLMTLCEECHKTRQGFEDKIKIGLGVRFAKTNIDSVKEIADRIDSADMDALSIRMVLEP